MQIFKNANLLQEFIKSSKKTVGFIPTMGALHEGHISLITKAKSENELIVVSIFVNPAQFLPNEDLAKYPRRESADIKICELAGVDALFMPNASELYDIDEPKVCAPDTRGFILEGYQRPGHFDGVLTVVLKLLSITMADKAYFGQKDAQQLILITEMAKRFFLPTQIIACQTQRDDDGLALSSRNAYLSANERSDALKISRALFATVRLITKNESNVEILKDRMRQELEPLAIDYVAITDRGLNNLTKLKLGNSILLIAARVGAVRLIDNLWV